MNLEEKNVCEITGNFKIEAYQRGYRWGEEEVEYLLENSIDKVDRIAFAIAKIKKLVQENMSV